MLLDVMDDSSFFKKTLQLLAKHTRFRKWQRTPPSRLRLGQPQEVLHTIQSNRLLHYPLRSPYSPAGEGITALDRKSTRLNSSHSQISYAVFCLKKKHEITTHLQSPNVPERL